MNVNTIGLILTCMLPFFAHTTELKKSTSSTEITEKKKSITSRCITNVKATGHFLGGESWEIGKILGLTIGSSAAYGILHDQVTARICLEYFSKGFHETMVKGWRDTGLIGATKTTLLTTQSPTKMACIWGVIATLVVGVLSGTLLSIASRFGEKDKYKAKNLKKPMALVMAATGACSALALCFPVPPSWIDPKNIQGVPSEKLTAFCRCASAHNVAYAVGAIGTISTALFILHQRLKETDKEKQKKKLLEQLLHLQTRKTGSIGS